MGVLGPGRYFVKVVNPETGVTFSEHGNHVQTVRGAIEAVEQWAAIGYEATVVDTSTGRIVFPAPQDDRPHWLTWIHAVEDTPPL